MSTDDETAAGTTDDRDDLSPLGRQMVAGLEEFADVLRADTPLEDAFRVVAVNGETGERVEMGAEPAGSPTEDAVRCRHESVTYVVASGRLTCNACGREL